MLDLKLMSLFAYGAVDLSENIVLIAILFAAATIITPTLHIDLYSLASVNGAAPGRMAIECSEGDTHLIQFIWHADEPPTDADLSRLTATVEQVNWLFWRDSDSDSQALLPNWKTTEDCRLDVATVPADVDIVTVPNTKTIILEDTKAYCGMAIIFDDDRPGADNLNNSGSLLWASTHCLNYYVIAHELMHSFGAVQLSAAHSDGGWHGTQFDVMGRPSLVDGCNVHDRLDCGQDDYWTLRPGGMSSGRWNSADSLYLRPMRRYRVILHPVYVGAGPP